MTGFLGVGIVGLGFMGRTHAAAYRAAARAGRSCRVVAACDRGPRRAEPTAGNLETGEIDPRDDPAVTAHERVEDLLADPRVDVVSVCTYTESHVPIALAALEAGKHVLVEKPVALASDEVERLALAARASDRVCMPALCMRFWPAWRWLRDRVRAGSFGAVRSAVFRRVGSRPAWGNGFYDDAERCGGALLDLHVHDADFVLWCFGAPESVAAAGTPDHLTALYRYAGGPPHVAAEGGWDHSPGFPFRMRYTVVFDEATADFDLGREPELVLARGGAVEGVAVAPGDGWRGEVLHLLDAIAGRAELEATVEDALAHTRLLEAERASMVEGVAVSTAQPT